MKKGDKIIILLLGIIIIAWVVVQTVVLEGSNDMAKKVEIKINGDLYKTIHLDNLNEDDKVIKIDNEYGINTIHIDEEGAEIVYADCPDQVCVRTAKITRQGRIIACLPHKLSVEIVSDEEEGLDGISQ